VIYEEEESVFKKKCGSEPKAVGGEEKKEGGRGQSCASNERDNLSFRNKGKKAITIEGPLFSERRRGKMGRIL